MSSASFSSSHSGGESSNSHVSTSTAAGPVFSMFPTVEKTYRPRINEDIERDLRFLGQSRVDALTSDFSMSLVKDKGKVKIYELCEKEFFTMKGVATVNAPLLDVMEMLKMDSTSKLRQVMGEIFGTLFLDGVVVHKGRESPARVNESLSINWMALQSSKPHLPHRDYVFLRYADVFEKNAEHGSMYQSSGSGLYVGASIWESVELDTCDPLPASMNVVRLRLRRCGIVVEELNTEDSLKISLFMSESHPGRAAVSTLTKAWMTKVVSCAENIAGAMVTRALSSANLLTKKEFVKDGNVCHICIKTFSLLRRKHHCRVCGDVVCSKCSEVKQLKQGGVAKEIRICEHCRNNSTNSVRSSDSDLRSNRPGTQSKPSFTAFSSTSSDITSSYDEDSNAGASMSSIPTPIYENSTQSSLSDSNSESARIKTYPSAKYQQQRSVHHDKLGGPTANDMILLNSSKQTNSSAPEIANDMILLNSKASLSKEAPSTAYSEFGISLTKDEMAAMELASTVHENTPFTYALSYTNRQDWPKAPMPANELARLKKVRSLHLADPGQHFQEMCEYAAAEMGCQIAAICFIGDKSGFLMSKVGLDKRELPRNVLLDSHTIMSEEPTIILDATEDIRFVNNPLVTDGQVRFYAGFPMISSDGYVVGSFSVADPFARESLAGDKVFFLKNLAEVTMRGIEQNTLNMTSVVPSNGEQLANVYDVPPPPDMNIVDAHMTMQELLRTAYSTQCQVRMQVNPLSK